MNQNQENFILQMTGARTISARQRIQSLWSGYGEIVRCFLSYADAADSTVIVKDVQMPTAGHHPRGWNTDLSHQRKVKSYQVESAFYQHYANLCHANCRVPKVLGMDNRDDEVFFILEDLDAVGFDQRKSSVLKHDMELCVSWLAHFHAVFLFQQDQPTSEGIASRYPELWGIGTYWHLDTRPEELQVLDDNELKSAASGIDAKLNSAHWKTLVHGDAKLANFCFSPNNTMNAVAAVDFQYVGCGCGMKDLAYFLGSCLNENQCEAQEKLWLDFYFQELRKALSSGNSGGSDGSDGSDAKIMPNDAQAIPNKAINEIRNNPAKLNDLEREWRNLYPYAWADFHRFLKGWSPGHWKMNTYSERLTRQVIENLRSKSH